MKETKLKNAMRFYLLATQLKYKIRSGWDGKHWNVSKERVESIAEHVYGTCILAISLDSEFECHIDLNKVIKMLVIHELGEVVIGDITPFDNVSKEEKLRIEHEAVSRQEELPLKPLSELYVIVSHHTAPSYHAVGIIPNFQCAKRFGSLFAISINQLIALFLEFSFLHFLLAHLIKHLLIYLNTSFIPDL